MEQKKMKKLVLKKTIVANLDGNAMNSLLGGYYTVKDNTNSTLATNCNQGTCPDTCACPVTLTC